MTVRIGIAHVLVAAAVVLGSGTVARAHSAAAEQCGSPSAAPAQTIAACTQLLQGAKLTGKTLAIAYNNRGVAYFKSGQVDAAIADFGAALRADPKFAGAAADRAAADLRKNDAQAAIADYTLAIKLAPDDAGAYHRRGLVYQNLGQDALAISDFTQAVKLDPSDAVAYYYRGLAYHDAGKDDLAAADFRSALRLNPNLAPAQAALQRLTH